MCARLRDQSGQSTVEWTGLVLLVMVLCVGLVAAGAPLPGTGLARSIAGRILCAIDLSPGCGRNPELIAVYGAELADLVRAHAPDIAYESGMHALPVDFRSCRSTDCGDGRGSGLVSRSGSGQPVTLFVHVIDCREGHAAETAAAGEDCSGGRAGHLYIQYWTYYANSATYRGVPIAGDAGFHDDDWEGYQVRVNPDGSADARASSHDGYNYSPGGSNPTSFVADAGIGPIRDAAEDVGLRGNGGWGAEKGWLSVSGGSHAGHADGDVAGTGSATLRGHLSLVPLEPIAAGEDGKTSFAITAPWLKHVWRDPEAEGTD